LFGGHGGFYVAASHCDLPNSQSLYCPFFYLVLAASQGQWKIVVLHSALQVHCQGSYALFAGHFS